MHILGSGTMLVIFSTLLSPCFDHTFVFVSFGPLYDQCDYFGLSRSLADGLPDCYPVKGYTIAIFFRCFSLWRGNDRHCSWAFLGPCNDHRFVFFCWPCYGHTSIVRVLFFCYERCSTQFLLAFPWRGDDRQLFSVLFSLEGGIIAIFWETRSMAMHGSQVYCFCAQSRRSKRVRRNRKRR